MGSLVRGIKNAFRNPIRTLSVTIILAVSIGLALVMLLAHQTVQERISSVKQSIGNIITISPAGSQGFEGGGEPLTDSQMTDVQKIDHVIKVSSTLIDRLTPTTDTSLASAIDPGTLGNRRFNRGNGALGGGTNNNPTRTFVIPINVTGLSDTSSLTASTTKITAGALFDPTSTDLVVMVGKDLASKNNLSVDSTFTAYSKTLTVKGIYDSGNRFGDSGLYLPIKTLQTLSDQAGQITSATAQVDSISNVETTVSAIKNKLGADKADASSNLDASSQALAPLENISTISLYSLFGALIAGALITLLTMMMIVRERRREIGVLKAIGASNTTVVSQFVAESLVLTLLSSLIGVALGAYLSNPILRTLVSSTATTGRGGGPGGFGGGGFSRGFMAVTQLGGNFQNSIRDIHTIVGWNVLLYGLLAAVGIAIIGSAVPAWLIAQIRPAEVMRGE